MIIESVLDIPRGDLDPALFMVDGKQPLLLPEVRMQILQLASQYSQWVKIKKVLLIGSILTKQYSPATDLDVTLIVELSSEESYKTARTFAGEHADQDMVAGTEHPINFFVRDDENWDQWDSVYDVLNNRWLRYVEVVPEPLEAYLGTFRKYIQSIDIDKGELVRDLVDYNELEQFNGEEVGELQKQAQQKLREIDSDVKKLVSSYKTLHALRKISFHKTMTPEEIKRYTSRNLLPANIAYKLLARYHYSRLLMALKQTLKQAGGNIDEPEEVGLVRKVVGVESVIDKLVGEYDA